MADWGAEVIKIEPPTGDPMRGLFITAAGIDVPINPPFELDNRGKRSIGVNLLHDAGRAVRTGSSSAPTSWSRTCAWRALDAPGLDFAALRRPQPAARLLPHQRLRPERGPTAIGPRTTSGRSGRAPASPRRWRPRAPSRRSSAAAMGDHTTAVVAVGAVCAALLARAAHAARGSSSSTSLLAHRHLCPRLGHQHRLRLGRVASPYDARHVPNPFVSSYRAGTTSWFWLLGLQGDRHWPDLVRAIERPELAARRALRDIRARREHAAELRRASSTRSLPAKPSPSGARCFDRAGMWWAPVQIP